MTNVVLPDLGEGIETATVSCWYFVVGDLVNTGDDFVELVTDKAAFNVPAPVTGVVKDIVAPEGAEIKIGDLLARIE